MMIRYLFVSAALLLLNACTGLGFNNTGGFSTRNTVGRNIDEVMAEFSKAGLRCSGKGVEKEVFTNKLLGNPESVSKQHKIPIFLLKSST